MSRLAWLDGLRYGDVVYLPLHHPARIDQRTVTSNGPKFITLNGGARIAKPNGVLENAPYTPIYASIEDYQQDVRIWAKLHDVAEGLRALSRQRKPLSITMAEVEELQRAFVALGGTNTAKREGYGRN